MWRAIRTKSRLDEFINEAMLTPLDVEILQTRLKGWSRVENIYYMYITNPKRPDVGSVRPTFLYP